MHAIEMLPITEVIQPESVAELATLVGDSDTAIYPLGGQTSLDFGLIPRKSGIGVSLQHLNAIVDYPARDMTITVEAGITMQKLAATLAVEQQHLPIDVPHPGRATLGGVIATNFSGARRYGCGTMRDYVIGVQAVDARGTTFNAGGRVVKNVAGYDFCKLLTGSLGTLGIITQVTLKLKPIPASSVLVACTVPDAQTAEQRLGDLVNTATTPVAIELLAGHAWEQADSVLSGVSPDDEYFGWLVVGLEGTAPEVEWMVEQLPREWSANASHVFRGADADALWQQLRDFSAADDESNYDFVIKATTVASGTVPIVAVAKRLGCDIQAHAGDGVTILRFSDPPAAGLTRVLSAELMPLATHYHGNVTMLAAAQPGELTATAVWGRGDQAVELMTGIKAAMDPHNRLNPGRFVYHGARR